MIEYYVQRWEQLHLIYGFNKEYFPDDSEEERFCENPVKLLSEIHEGRITPFKSFAKEE